MSARMRGLANVCQDCGERPCRCVSQPQPREPAKAPLDRLGEIPRALRALASQIAFGSTKPGRVPGGWRQCSREALIAKALRHLVDAASGEVIDDEGRSHLVAAMTDCALAVELEGKP